MLPIPFGKYLLIERLAQGGMAEVYRAVYQGAAGFEKQLAIKRILPVFDGIADFVRRFIDEARIASSLTHVNIAQVFDFGEVDGSYFLAMELVDGLDLGRLCQRAAECGRRLPLPMAAFIVAESARGLAYAHDKCGPDGAPLGIVHRDVSPHNLLVSYAGEVKLVDFGIAKATGKVQKTETGALVGKLRYMSPEQLAGEPLDGRSDLFALGVVLWELLAGRPLWPGDNPGAVTEQIKSLPIEPPSRYEPSVSAELDRIALMALARAPDARYARAAELARDLSAWLAQSAPTLTREDVGQFVSAVLPRQALRARRDSPVAALATTALAKRGEIDGVPAAAPRPTRWWRVVGVGAALLLLLGGGLIVQRSRAKPPPPHRVPVVAPPDAHDAGPPVTASAPLAESTKLRLVAALEALPRAASTWRGVPSEDYLAVMTALDAALCHTVAGAREPALPPEIRARLEAEQLIPETTAVWRYLSEAGSLPPRVEIALQTFLRNHRAWSVGAPGWAMARLGALRAPHDRALRLEVIRENGAIHGWRSPPDRALPHAALCERQAAVAAYASLGPGPLAAAFSRWLRAVPPEQPVVAGGWRYTLLEAERDTASATLLVRLRVANPGATARPVTLTAVRLVGLDAAPEVDPPGTQLGPGTVRELRLTFAGVSDAVAEAAVLQIEPGIELAAYSEDLQ